MINLSLFLFVCSIFCTGFLQELTGYNSFPSFVNSGRPLWPRPVNYNEPHVLRKKPCPHGRHNNQEQWVPSFRSMVKKPLYNDVLQPLALKNENDIAVNGSTATDTLDITDKPIVSHNSSEHSLNISNNVSENIVPNRRSMALNIPENSEDQSMIEDYDCDFDLDTVDYSEFQYQKGQSEELASKPTFEQKILDMLSDCMKNKKKLIKDSEPDQFLFVGSRRSMSGSDNDNSPVDDNKQPTTDVNENVSDGANVSEDNINDRVTDIETSSFTLRPGKLFNELQNPTKVTGITNIPASRRMQAENTRICYACSTATNPSCWEPDSKTTIKYCRKDQNCVTKSIGVKNSLTVLRDCATSCEASSIAGIEPKYKSCSVCHKDLCNGAAINTNNLVIIFIITAIKCTF